MDIRNGYPCRQHNAPALCQALRRGSLEGTVSLSLPARSGRRLSETAVHQEARIVARDNTVAYIVGGWRLAIAGDASASP